MNKRDLILDAMESLMKDDNGANCSVSDIAKKAGIGKGSIYYYFESKEEIFDALVERIYGEVINKCQVLITQSHVTAIEKIALLFQSYMTSDIEKTIGRYLHDPHNATIHQKSLATILLGLKPLLSLIIKQGISDGIFQCDYPSEFSEIILSELCFVLDPGIFTWTNDQIQIKLKVIAHLMESYLHAPTNSFSFLINPQLFKQRK